MDCIDHAWLNELKFEHGLSEGEWTYMPISTASRSDVDYLTLNDAVERNLATVCEVSSAGNVPQMLVTNKASLPLFIPDGMTLVGCKQNRVVNLSLLIPANSETRIPVSCVEAGRWRPDSAVSQPADICDPELRSAMSEQTSASLRTNGTVSVNQEEVWSHVGKKLEVVGARSLTSAYQEVFNSSAARRRRDVPYREGACGVVVFHRGRICSLDLFDKSSTLKTYWSQIVRSTVALETTNSKWEGDLQDPRQFLSVTLSQPQGEFEVIGQGTHCRFRSSFSVGSALLVKTQPVHVAVFRRRDNPVPPSAETKRDDNPPPRRGWRRFWK